MALLESMIKTEKAGKKENLGFSVIMVHYTKLVPSESNNYSVEKIEKLANSILLSGGIKQNLLARKKSPDEYELIAGHRRRLAVKYLVEVLGHNEFSMVPVHVEKSDDTMSEINLILTNSGARERSDWEKMMEVSRLTELIKALQNGTAEDQERFRQIFGQDAGIGGREIRKLVAEKLGLSETKVANLKNIENNLVPELKDKFKEGTIGVSAANAAASLSVPEQKELAEKEEIRIADVKKKAVSESDTEGKEKSVSESDTGKRKAEREIPYYDIPGQEEFDFAKGNERIDRGEEDVVPVFTSELSAEHAYGWTWQEVVKAYLSKVRDQGWKEGKMPEIMFHCLGQEYHAAIEGTRVAFSMDGKIQFLVEDERLRKEYDFFHPDKNVAEEQQSTQNAAEMQREEEAQEPLSAYGTPKRVYPMSSLITTDGCEGGHDCFSCAMDCQIRQKERYCREAPMGNPYSCETLCFGLEEIREKVGEKCQFINHDLAFHRTGDGEPDPCCKKCEEPCEYICGRAMQAAAEEQQNDAGCCENAADGNEKPKTEGESLQEPLTDLQLLRDMLDKQKDLLREFLLTGVDENDDHIRKQKLLVEAIASMVTDLEGIQEGGKLDQPELPQMKNNDQRKEWLRKYRDWGLWYEDKNIGAKYYKYDFDNGARLIAEEYGEHSPYCGDYVSSFLHLVGGPEPPQNPTYGFGKWSRHETYSHHPDNETELVEFLKEVQRK